ncbi:Aldehyde dehydrogenase family protein, partial [Brevibacterium sp. Mu109]
MSSIITSPSHAAFERTTSRWGSITLFIGFLIATSVPFYLIFVADANIVFGDADLELAAATAPYGVFDNAGQDCCARSRILVHDSVFERFMELLEPAVSGVVVTDPSLEEAEMGPLISRGHRESVAGFLEGVDIAFTGSAPSGAGYWMAPTVVLPKTPR